MLKNFLGISLLSFALLSMTFSQAQDNDFGQVIQIHTDLCSFRGQPSWLLIVRDVDQGINFPYLYDFTQGSNFWLALSHSKNYLITVSQLQMQIYNPKENMFRRYVMKNFCGLESNGRIIHNDSFSIRITGDLKPYSDTLVCNVSQYFDPNAAKAMGIQ